MSKRRLVVDIDLGDKPDGELVNSVGLSLIRLGNRLVELGELPPLDAPFPVIGISNVRHGSARTKIVADAGAELDARVKRLRPPIIDMDKVNKIALDALQDSANICGPFDPDKAIDSDTPPPAPKGRDSCS